MKKSLTLLLAVLSLVGGPWCSQPRATPLRVMLATLSDVCETKPDRGERVARKLEAGAVDINDVMIHGFSFALPMGGWKHSGIGLRNGGAAGLQKYCRPQAITAPRIPTLSRELLWYPYSRRKFRLAMGVVRAAAARGLRRASFTPRGGQ